MHQDIILTFYGDDREDFKGTLRTFMSPADQVAFERHFKQALGNDTLDERAEYALWMIYRAWNREQRAGLDFEEFLEELADYDLPKDEEDGDALPPAEATPSG